METANDIGDSLPSYLIRIRPAGKAIYLLLILLVLLIMACLPLVSVPVSVSGWGIIRPNMERAQIIVPCSGIVEKVYVSEGDMVHKSAALLRIQSTAPRENLADLYRELKEAEYHQADLAQLTNHPVRTPITPEYLKEYHEYLDRLSYLELLRNKTVRELERLAGLFEGGLISEKEYDDLQFASRKAEKELENYINQCRTKWQAEYYKCLSMTREIKAKIRLTEEHLRLTTVKAPEKGNLVEFSSIFEGSAVQAGTVIGVLSPESNLIGEFYISSRNLTFLHTGQAVHLHIDAFSSREWGIISGSIYEISSDYILLNNQPVYRVKCSLDRTGVELNNGFSTKLRKGMTFQARCLLTERTLFQLLADKTENWLDPASQEITNAVLP